MSSADDITPPVPFPSRDEEVDTLSVRPVTLAWDTTPAGDNQSISREDDSSVEQARNSLIFQFPFDQGGTGEIWQAIQGSLKRVVAVKRVLPEHYRRHQQDSMRLGEVERRFREEARITASLEHPNIVPVYDVKVDEDGHPLLVMKLVNGTSWLRLLRMDFRSMDYESYLAQHLPVFVSVLQAVAFAHSRGIIHLDLKPSQVMVGEFGETLLMDWGLAMTVDDLAEGSRLAAPAGTPVMMSPEQAGAEDFPVGFHTDIYLLGGTLYFILTNHYPHEENNTPKAVERAKAGKVRPPSEMVEGVTVPKSLADLALRAMSYNPADRPLAVGDLVAVIQDYLGGAATRREAVQILKEVTDRLEALEEDSEATGEMTVGSSDSRDSRANTISMYRALAELQSRLSYAGGLWKRTPGIREVRERVARTYFDVAFRSGDLRLARTVVETIDSPEQRGALIDKVDRAERDLARKGILFRASVSAVALMAVVILVGTARYALDMQHLSATIALERDVATQARLEAEAAHIATIAERNAVDLARKKAEEAQYFSSIRLAERNIQDLRLREAENQLASLATGEIRGPEWGLLAARITESEMTLHRISPPGRLHYAEYSPDGSRIASGDNAGNVMLWEASTGRRIGQKQLTDRGIWYTSFTPDGTRLVVTSFDNKARILNAETLEVIHVLEGHTDILRGTTISPDSKQALTCSADRTAILWDLETGAQISSYPNVPSRLSSADFSNDGKVVAIAGTNYASIREPQTGKLLVELPSHPENILDIDISPDGTKVATACTDRNIRVFNAKTGALIRTLANRTSWLHSIHFHPYGHRLVSSDNDGTIRIWNPDSGEIVREFNSPPQAFRVRYSPSGRTIISTSTSQISIWAADTLSGSQPLKPTDHPLDPADPPTMVRAFATPMEPNVSRSTEWDTPGYRVLLDSNNSVTLAHSYYLAPAPDAQRGVWISPTTRKAEIRTIGKWEKTSELSGADYYFFTWHPDGKRFYSAEVDGAVRLWDAETLESQEILPGNVSAQKPGEYPGLIAVSAEGRLVAVVRPDRIIRLFDAATGALVREIPYDDGLPGYVALSPDASLVAVGGHSFRSKIYKTSNGEVVCATTGHEGVVSGGMFWKDGSRLLTWGADDRILLHETTGGKEVVTIANISQKEGAVGAAFSRDWTKVYVQLSNLEVYSYPIFPIEAVTRSDDGMHVAREIEAYKRSQRLGTTIPLSDVDWSDPSTEQKGE